MTTFIQFFIRCFSAPYSNSYMLIMALHYLIIYVLICAFIFNIPYFRRLVISCLFLFEIRYSILFMAILFSFIYALKSPNLILFQIDFYHNHIFITFSGIAKLACVAPLTKSEPKIASRFVKLYLCFNMSLKIPKTYSFIANFMKKIKVHVILNLFYLCFG